MAITRRQLLKGLSALTSGLIVFEELPDFLKPRKTIVTFSDLAAKRVMDDLLKKGYMELDPRGITEDQQEFFRKLADGTLPVKKGMLLEIRGKPDVEVFGSWRREVSTSGLSMSMSVSPQAAYVTARRMPGELFFFEPER